jgi:diketogulonate reductase-like aldo/keto reductase
MLELRGVQLPTFLYGTAWKEDRTEALTSLALSCGFRGIDTANQRRHYVEAAVGAAIRKAIEQGALARDDLFLQTKFTFLGGQDQRLPYDAAAPIAEQVKQSFESSLMHLGCDRLDAYVLHGPTRRSGLGADDWAAWRAMEALQQGGRTRWLGVSNVSCEQLELLCAEAEVLPAFVQNRCFARSGWDRRVRELCSKREIVYQGFSLLTANGRELASPALRAMADELHCSMPQLVFRFAQQMGMLPLTGTSNEQHMREDLACGEVQLSRAQLDTIERVAG